MISYYSEAQGENLQAQVQNYEVQGYTKIMKLKNESPNGEAHIFSRSELSVSAS